MFQNPSDERRRQLLEEAKTIAVVGLSNKPERTSHMVAAAMQNAGYRIIPVNPTIAGETVLGEKAVASLSEIDEPVDIVNVFRRSEDVPPVAEEAVKLKPKALWLQQGIVNEEAAALAKQHGIEVIMDLCIKVDHALLRVGKK
ncbi:MULTISPECIES: CoA-binding protein [Bacillales]|jgi:predicted CoA-binding protein|uniref:CoA-binding protein n=1 Tax=Brevibacillus aydinogluensis TaxID=927786 RepID=A0AA48RBE0_9BACL|nr:MULTISPECIES: CoA-binding protein [Bacillales]REK65227.1 MAG: CoA-binding protein [Brevibacillus sp.]MBR8658770.1 CoA-binding protein [Brevibacillus sp. NL20B1]MDT3415915.1 putative CoA-binding protein [Brevibacillus aydinogluensis]NNV04477.1 CoA-binding protein [Brevibacillus sp. MCWH]UFJ61634.1 CoA-binding protein [Anoxybacillus sediminis]